MDSRRFGPLFKSGQARWSTQRYSARMTIDRDNAAERQERVDRMIEEFREAQARRSAKRNDEITASNADPKAPLTGSVISQ